MNIPRTIRHITLLLLAAALFMGGCAAVGLVPAQGTMGVTIEFPEIIQPIGGRPVDVVILHLEAADGGETMELELDVDDDMASAFVDVNPGTWYLNAELYDGRRILIATGYGTAVVLSGVVTKVNLYINLVDGALDIEIDWDSVPPLYAADISHRPVAVEISGCGTFFVSGLSRVGWDFEVFEFPSSNGRTVKEPGELTYPELAMLNLRSSSTEVGLLANWAASPDPRSMTMILEGIGGERVRLNFYEVIPVTANTDVLSVDYSDEVEMAGLRVRFNDIQMAEYTGTFINVRDWGLPEPGQWVEIAGVEAGLGYEVGVLEVPEPGSNPAFWFPSVRGGEQMFDWAKNAVLVIEEFGSIERKDVGIVNVDEYGEEIDRINLHGVWPAGINLFNPEKPYGANFLIDVFVVGESAEQR